MDWGGEAMGILGGQSKFNLYSVLGGGAIKTYFDNRSGLEKFLKE